MTKTLAEHLNLLVVVLNDKAVKAADRRVAEVIRTAGEQREQAERELADASQTVDGLETKLDQATAETKTLESKLAEVQATSREQTLACCSLYRITPISPSMAARPA